MNNIIKYQKGRQKIIIDLVKSAPNQIKPFPGIESLCNHWRAKGYREIIDVGCGQLRNALVLIKYFELWICDFPQQLQSPAVRGRLNSLKHSGNFMGFVAPDEFERTKLAADAAVIAYVLHTLPEVQMRRRLIRGAIQNTKHPHEIFVAVPNGESYYRRRIGAENQLNDGNSFESGGGYKTCYREYTSVQIDNFMAEMGFVVGKIFLAHKKNQRTYLKKKG